MKGNITITQVISHLVKLKINGGLTAKDIRKSVNPVIKTCTEAITFLGHANQEVDSIRRTIIAMLLPKDLYPLAKDLPIPPEWLFGDDINARVNNIKAQQKAFNLLNAIPTIWSNTLKQFDGCWVCLTILRGWRLKGYRRLNFKPDRTFDRQAYFPKQNFKKGRDFQNAPEIKIRGTKTNGQNSHTRKQGNGKKESTY